jgi:hypothetical protein
MYLYMYNIILLRSYMCICIFTTCMQNDSFTPLHLAAKAGSLAIGEALLVRLPEGAVNRATMTATNERVGTHYMSSPV